MKNVLIVDDEAPFLLSLESGLPLCGADFNVFTAANGKRALEVLDFAKVDLVVTALKMPEMDGLELLASMKERHPGVPVILMTSFGTAEIEDHLRQLDALQHLEKPLDLAAMARAINLALGAGDGHLKDIALPTFLQLVEMEQKTSTLTIRSNGRVGRLFFQAGALLDAETETGAGEAAALEILGWEDTTIDISGRCARTTRRITPSLNHLLMEAFHLKDERGGAGAVAPPPPAAPAPAPHRAPRAPRPAPPCATGAIADAVREVAEVPGFGGLGVFTPEGELLVQHGDGETDMAEVGVLANGVLMTLQKTSLEMGFGSTHMVHFETDDAHVLVRCHDESATDGAPGAARAHLHLVLVLTSAASLGLAKMRLNRTAVALAEHLRG